MRQHASAPVPRPNGPSRCPSAAEEGWGSPGSLKQAARIIAPQPLSCWGRLPRCPPRWRAPPSPRGPSGHARGVRRMPERWWARSQTEGPLAPAGAPRRLGMLPDAVRCPALSARHIGGGRFGAAGTHSTKRAGLQRAGLRRSRTGAMSRACQGLVKGLSRACQGLVKGFSRACQGLCRGLVKGLSRALPRACQGARSRSRLCSPSQLRQAIYSGFRSGLLWSFWGRELWAVLSD